MLSNQKCTAEKCGVGCRGYVTTTEIRMNELNPSRSVQEYHEIMELFEDAFDSDPANN